MTRARSIDRERPGALGGIVPVDGRGDPFRAAGSLCRSERAQSRVVRAMGGPMTPTTTKTMRQVRDTSREVRWNRIMAVAGWLVAASGLACGVHGEADSVGNGAAGSSSTGAAGNISVTGASGHGAAGSVGTTGAAGSTTGAAGATPGAAGSTTGQAGSPGAAGASGAGGMTGAAGATGAAGMAPLSGITVNIGGTNVPKENVIA